MRQSSRVFGRAPARELMKFQVVCDSAADLPESVTQGNFPVVPFYVSMDSVNYKKEKVDISVTDFYQTMVDNSSCFPKTSMPTIPDYLQVFRPLAEQGMPILCICLTQKFSGSYQSACNAAAAVRDEFPNVGIEVMDSHAVTVMEGVFVREALRLRDKDLSLEEAVPLLEEIRDTGHIFFTTKDLKYLEHGGRLGKVASIAGSVLNLKPVLHFCNGDLGTTEVCRGRRKSLQRVIEKFAAYVKEENIDLSEYYFATGIGLEPPEYEEFREDVEICLEKLGQRPGEFLDKQQIGATIGVHTGPWPMGLGLLKKCKV